MAQGLSYRVEDDIGVLCVNQTPGRLNRQVIDQLDAALDQACADGVSGVVIGGQGHGFPGGPPLSEILCRSTAENLAELCSRVAGLEVPIVVAMQGTVRDGALSLALAAHARVADSGTRIGFTEIELGLCPFAGATQRLPALVGAGPALDLMMSGRIVAAQDTGLAGLCQQWVDRDVTGAAMDLARDLASERRALTGGRVPEMPGLADPIIYQRAIADARKVRLSAEARAIVDCIEAAQLLPMEAGQAFETTMFHTLRESPRAAALVHVACAEASHLSARHPPLKDVVVFGESRIARGLVLACLETGARVHLAERVEGGAGPVIKEIERIGRDEVEAGHISAEAARARLSRLSGGRLEDMIGRGEIVIEAGGFALSEMRGVAERVTSATRPDVPILLGSNIALRAGTIAHLFQGRVLGAAFQPPPQVARLVELIVPDGVSAEAVIRSEAMIRAMNKVALHVAPRNGCLLQTLVAQFFSAAQWCVLHGAAPWEVDRALGWRNGPFAMMDREGLGAQPARLTAILGHEPDHSLNRALLAAGRDGRASGRGFYRYDADDGTPRADPETEALVARWRAGQMDGHAPDAEEIRQRIMLALVSTGLALSEAGTIGRAAEVDLAAIHGLGMPRSSGGPMKWAEATGLIQVRKALQGFSQSEPQLWQSSPILDDLINNGAGFGD